MIVNKNIVQNPFCCAQAAAFTPRGSVRYCFYILLFLYDIVSMRYRFYAILSLLMGELALIQILIESALL